MEEGEKIFRRMSSSGTLNLMSGIILAAGGVALGVMLIVSGVKLLTGKDHLIF